MSAVVDFCEKECFVPPGPQWITWQTMTYASDAERSSSVQWPVYNVLPVVMGIRLRLVSTRLDHHILDCTMHENHLDWQRNL